MHSSQDTICKLADCSIVSCERGIAAADDLPWWFAVSSGYTLSPTMAAQSANFTAAWPRYY